MRTLMFDIPEFLFKYPVSRSFFQQTFRFLITPNRASLHWSVKYWISFLSLQSEQRTPSTLKNFYTVSCYLRLFLLINRRQMLAKLPSLVLNGQHLCFIQKYCKVIEIFFPFAWLLLVHAAERWNICLQPKCCL